MSKYLAVITTFLFYEYWYLYDIVLFLLQPVNLNNDVVSCSRNMECGWLVCLWAQESNAEYGCQFFHNQ